MDQDPFYGFGDKGWSAINGKHCCQGGRHRKLARYIRVSIPSMQISKILLPHRVHTLTVLSVNKPRPRPIDCHGFVHKQQVHLSGSEYETNLDKESGLSEKYLLSPFLPAHEGLRAMWRAWQDELTKLKISCIDYHFYPIVT